MRKQTKVIGFLVLACLLIGLPYIPAPAAAAAQPTAAVTISYDVAADLAGMTQSGGAALTNATTYYVAATDGSYSPTGLSITKPSAAAYWKIVVDGSWVRTPELYLKGHQLVEFKGGNTLDIRNTATPQIITATGSRYDIGGEGNDKPPEDKVSGHLAVKVGTAYYLQTSAGWAPAIAQVQDNNRFYYKDIISAITAANAHGSAVNLMLLENASIGTTVSTNPVAEIQSHVTVRYCNGKQLTVTAGGNLTLGGTIVLDADDTRPGILLLKNGGTVKDSGGNHIDASYDIAMKPPGHTHSTVEGLGTKGTTLNFSGGTATARVNISGHFATANGYFDLIGDTVLDTTAGTADTAASSAYIVARTTNSNLTIHNGAVHTLCGFETGAQVKITNGTLFVQQQQGETTVINGLPNGTGGERGIVKVERGTASVYGKLNQLDISGVLSDAVRTYVTLCGVADTVTETGASDLTVKTEKMGVGDVTTIVTGVEGSTCAPILRVGSDTVGTAPRKLEIEGTFYQVTGRSKVTGKVTIQDASGTTEVTGTAGELTIGKVDKNSAAPVLNGSFKILSLTETTIPLKETVTITDTLVLKSANVTAQGGGANVVLGEAGKKLNCTMTDSTIKLFGASANVNITGVSGAKLYLDETTNGNNSKVGIRGQFDAVTGHVHTCEDVTVHSTIDAGTFGQDKAIIVGGTPQDADVNTGKLWGLTLDDTLGNTTVALDSRKDGTTAAAPVSAAFQYIKVVDTVDNAARVSLTMASQAQPVTLENRVAAAAGGEVGLSATGDAKTVITLNTNGISGNTNAVTLTGVEASLTGATAATQIEGRTGDAIVLNKATLHLKDYTVDGEKNGITVAQGSSLNLQSAITVLAVGNGLNVLDGTVTNAYQTGFSGAGTVTVTGGSSAALSVTKGTANLKDYTFLATGASGMGVWTQSNSAAEVTLSATVPGTKTIQGYQTGVVVASGTTLTLTNYRVYGGTQTVQANANEANTQGGQIAGALRLAGENTFLGGGYGLTVTGTVTNYQLSDGTWTVDEKAVGAAPVGSGSILGGVTSNAAAIHASSSIGRVTLGSYQVHCIGNYGLHAVGAQVYLKGGASANNTVTGDKLWGVMVNTGNVTIDGMAINSTDTNAAAAGVQSGVLNLGAGVTLGGTGRHTVVGSSKDAAQLHVDSGNKNISAQGAFASLTGYVATTEDLQVIGTQVFTPYLESYHTGLEILGGGLTHDLLLGDSTHLVEATLADNGSFSSISVTGGTAVQQKLTIAGGLTVANSLQPYYALFATYADVTMQPATAAAGAAVTPYARSFTASGASGVAIDAKLGSKLYLSDTVTMAGGQKGLSLVADALVTNQKKEDGSYCTTYDQGLTGTTAGSGSITGTTGVAVTVGNNAVLLLGDYAIKGGTRAVEVSGNASALLKTEEVKNIARTTGNTVFIDTIGHVLLQNYSMTNPNAAPIQVASGTVTVRGNGVTVPADGTLGVTISGADVKRALVVTAVSPKKSEVTLDGRVKMVSGIKLTDGKVTVADADIESIAQLKGGDGIAIEQISGSVIMQKGAITGTGIDAAAALQQTAGNAWMSGGTLTGAVALKTNLWMTGGEIVGTVTGTGDKANLHIGTGSAVVQPVNVAGTFASLTGKATAAGALTIATTTDAGNALSGNAFVDTTANNRLVLTGAAAAPGHTLTLTTGTVDLSGHFAKTTLKSGTVVTVIEDGAMADTSTVEANSTLTVNADKTLTIGDGTKTLHVAGDLVVSGNVIGNLNVTGTATIHGTVTGNIENSGTVTVTGAVTGNIENSGTVNVTGAGTITGTVTGTGTAANLAVKNTTGTDVAVTGTFANLETGDKNTVTMTNELTVNGTGTGTAHVIDHIAAQLTITGGEVFVDAKAGTNATPVTTNMNVTGGKAHVDATGAVAGANLVVTTGAEVGVQGNFAAINGTVTLEGATTIAGGTSTVNAGTTAYSLTVKGTAAVTAESGIYGDVTVQNTAKLTGKGGTYGKLVSADTATVILAGDTQIATASSVGAGSTLTVNAGKTLTIGADGKGTLTVAGTLNATGNVKGNLTATGTVNVTGTITGTVTGTAATLAVNNTAGTDVDVTGTFANLEAASKNTVTMVGALTIEASTCANVVDSIEDLLTVHGGTVHVDANGAEAGANLTVTAGTTLVKGNFATINGTVTLEGATTIAGGTSTVNAGSAAQNLTVKGTAAVTAASGTYGDVTVQDTATLTGNGGTYGKLVSADTATVTLTETTTIATASSVGAGSTLTVNAGKTLTIGTSGTLAVAGTLNATGSVIGNLNVAVTGTVNVTGSVTGKIETSGTVNVTGAGTITGTVTGTGIAANLAVKNTTGTNVAVTGTFANLETTGANTVTMTDVLTVNGTGTAPASAHVIDHIKAQLTITGGEVFVEAQSVTTNMKVTGGKAHVDATGAVAGANLAVTTGTAYVKGNFVTINGIVTLEGAATIAGGTATVVDSIDALLTVKGGTVHVDAAGAAAGAKLKVETTGTALVKGKFAEINGTVTQEGATTIAGGTALVNATTDALTVKGGTVTVDGEPLTVDGANLTVTGGTASIRGNFATAAGSVTLYGNTTIGGAANTVVENTQGPNAWNLTLTGSGSVTLKDGKFGSLAVTGKPTLTLVAGSYTSIDSHDFTAMSGALSVTGPVTAKGVVLGATWKSDALSAVAASLTSGTVEGKQMNIGTLTVGNAKKATLYTKDVSYLTGTLTVAADKITAFPEASAYGTYQGWRATERGNENIAEKPAEKPYEIVDGGMLRTCFYHPEDEVTPPKFDIITPEPAAPVIPGVPEEPEVQQSLHGEIVLEKAKEASQKIVTVRTKPHISFTVGAVTVLDADKNQVPVTMHADGTATFAMPASSVTVQAQFVPILGQQQQETPAPWYRVKSEQRFYLNGKRAPVQAYNINYNNYLKLRDLASLLNGTEKQFSVAFTDDAARCVSLKIGQVYVPVGGENIDQGDRSATAQVSNWTLEVDGVMRYLKCYAIGGNNYFQLRELSELLGIRIGYDAENGDVTLNTK